MMIPKEASPSLPTLVPGAETSYAPATSAVVNDFLPQTTDILKYSICQVEGVMANMPVGIY